ncbi:hypothetical protein EJB05_45905, partial [Eragrostis curvula]
LNMDSSDDSSTCSDVPGVQNLAKAALVLRRIKALQTTKAPVVNPIPKLSGAQWMQLNLQDSAKCNDNLRMTPDAFLNLHNCLGVPFFKREKQARMIISCFAMDNYLWLRKYRDGATYDPSEWVLMNTTTNTSTLRELVSAAVWPAR